MNKKYVIGPTEEERESLISEGTAPARVLNRAHVLLETNASGTQDVRKYERIAEALETRAAMVGRERWL